MWPTSRITTINLPYINCDSSDFWRGTDGSSRSLPEVRYRECQQTDWKKKSLYLIMCLVGWGVIEFPRSLSGNGVTRVTTASVPFALTESDNPYVYRTGFTLGGTEIMWTYFWGQSFSWETNTTEIDWDAGLSVYKQGTFDQDPLQSVWPPSLSVDYSIT